MTETHCTCAIKLNWFETTCTFSLKAFIAVINAKQDGEYIILPLAKKTLCTDNSLTPLNLCYPL